jgi:two-component system, NtrC family, response regulator HydG
MAPGVTVLVVEADTSLQRVLQQTLRPRYTVLTASCWTQAREIRARSDVDVVVADVNVAPDSSGLDSLCVEAGKLPFVLLASANGQSDSAPNGEGPAPLLTFAARPIHLPDLPCALENAIADRQIARDPCRPPAGDELTSVVAESRSMREAMALIDRAAQRDTPILLVGESGTGKELLARAIHKKSPRALGPFVAVNCSAIPEPLLESELFGHRRGAFTDARDDRPGLFQTAQRGTILLDEIGDMAPALQGKLLRVLQQREVHPLGASTPVSIDVRVVTATHRDLSTLVGEERFRQDLLYRINVIEVRVPPLRERPEDMDPLIGSLLDKHGAKLGKTGCTVSTDAMAVLRSYAWPGNVRELENVIERALVLGTGTAITLEDLPRALRDGPAPSPDGIAGRRLADVERDHIVRTLRAAAGNKAAAARVLGLNRKTLYRKLTQHRIAKRRA